MYLYILKGTHIVPIVEFFYDTGTMFVLLKGFQLKSIINIKMLLMCLYKKELEPSNCGGQTNTLQSWIKVLGTLVVQSTTFLGYI